MTDPTPQGLVDRYALDARPDATKALTDGRAWLEACRETTMYEGHPAVVIHRLVEALSNLQKMQSAGLDVGMIVSATMSAWFREGGRQWRRPHSDLRDRLVAAILDHLSPLLAGIEDRDDALGVQAAMLDNARFVQSEMEKELSAANERIRALEEGLETFAECFGDDIPRPDDFDIIAGLTLGDFRKARALLSDKGTG